MNKTFSEENERNVNVRRPAQGINASQKCMNCRHVAADSGDLFARSTRGAPETDSRRAGRRRKLHAEISDEHRRRP
jgi:hypothetical protein